jgi:hypothetical protein
MQRTFNKALRKPYFRNGILGVDIAATSLWSPLLLGSGLKMWLDANDSSTITLNGSTVSQWNDKSGTGNHVSNGTAGSQPTYQATGFNSLPTVSFDGSNDFLGKSSVVDVPSTGDLFFGAIFEMDTTNGIWNWIVGHRSAANSSLNGAIAIQRGGGDNQIGCHNTDVADTRIKVDVTSLLVDRIATLGRAGGSSGNGGSVTVTATGPSGASYLTSGTQSWTSSSGSFLQIGGRQQSGTNFFDGQISEVIVCNRNLTTAERQSFEGYLAWKWNIVSTLPADHPYKNSPPTP